jgi:predicted ATPase
LNSLKRFTWKIRVDDEKHRFYRNIIQDILDSIGNDLKIKVHLADRIKSDDENSKRNLTSVLGKMNKKLTDVIFKSWNQIFGKQIRNKEIILFSGTDDKGAYLEFNIQDNVDTYRVVERSLGFRWFFVFLLLTQFRTYRKKNKDVLFLLDEPASNLHPSAQTQLLKSFENYQK